MQAVYARVLAAGADPSRGRKKDGKTALDLFKQNDFDICILDVMMPKKDGFSLAKDIRAVNAEIPLIFLTAKSMKEDTLEGFNSGADDYLVKPFNLDELSARIRALLRRRIGRSSSTITFKNIVMDPASYTVIQEGELVELSRKEFVVLQLLLENAGRVMSRTQLEKSLYSWKDEVDSNAVEVYIHRLRKKLDSDLIKTIRGVGYIVK